MALIASIRSTTPTILLTKIKPNRRRYSFCLARSMNLFNIGTSSSFSLGK